jgi:Yersinia/Haemophilus virulence surface antigen
MPKREIQAYDQSRDPRWYAGEVKPDRVGVGASRPEDFVPTDTSEGVCYGLSIWWIIKSAKKESFWDWMGVRGQQVSAGPHVSDIKNLFLAQKGDYEFSRFDNADKKIRAETRMTRQCEYLMEKGTKFDCAGYYYISLQGKFAGSKDNSGHAIAAYLVPDGKCRYFDPNFGEYETDTAEETLAEVKKLVDGYNIKDLKISWCCWK